MAENEEHPLERTSTQPSNSRPPSPARPTITLPPRTTFEALFNGGGGFSGSGGGFSGTGFSPGPMTLVSSFFSDAGDDCKSFSQLLAGALTSPPPPAAVRPTLPVSDGVGDADFLLQSPGIFSSGQGPFGMTMTHQQVLAQVTAQAAQANYLKVQTETEYLSSLSSSPATSLAQLPAFSPTSAALQEMPSLVPASATSIAVEESSDASHQDLNSQPSADKPNDDGYNWRKYGQKHVKGSEFPRSYYKCTHPNCPVKKKVERSLHGQVTEIIYKGEHNHLPPQTNKRGKDVGNSNGNPNSQSNHDLASQVQSGHFNKSKERTTSYSLSRKDQESSQATHEQTSGTSDSEEVGEAEVGLEENDEDEPEPKRQSMGVRHSEPASSHRTVTEPRIIVQTTSEVDLLDDGYRWRKYGQKVVKGNPYPRSYYKCTTPGCNVRKHVERASTDPKAVITTYEGKHNHDVPAGKSSSHNTANFNASNLNNKMDLRNNSQRPVGRLRKEEEQIT